MEQLPGFTSLDQDTVIEAEADNESFSFVAKAWSRSAPDKVLRWDSSAGGLQK
jgi:hypothetical protein